jgi:uncharacterized iron-regulated protein
VKKEILKLHWNIYQYLKKKAHSYEGKHSSELKRYKQDQLYYSERTFKPASNLELESSIINSQVIYIGDFHTFDQNQRSLHRIMRILLRNKKKFKLGLEMVHHQYQLYLDSYLTGHITELEFLESINYHESWRFPWNHYKIIFELLREFNIDAIAMNSSGSLNQRDNFATEIITEHLLENPNMPILIFFGELHILPNKIPKKVVINTKKNIRQCVIHQNLDEVYWSMKQNETEASLVRFSRDEYCLITSAPWVKYESMIYWYENTQNDPDFDINEYMIENGLKILGDNAFENFAQICLSISNNLQLKLARKEIDNFNLYDHTSLEFIETKIEGIKNLSVRKFYWELVKHNRSFKIPNTNIVYCPNYSMNKIAGLAGIHLYHLFLAQSKISPLNILGSRNNTKKFILLIYENMFSYFFAKIFNPHRKCNLYLDLKQKMSESKKNNHFYSDVINLIDDQTSLESLSYKKSLKKLYDLSRPIGYFLGEHLYSLLGNRDVLLNVSELKKQFLQASIDEISFYRIKKQLLPNLLYRMQKKKFF